MILIACEESQVLTAAFRANGQEAYSCDIAPTSGSHPEWHLQQDVLPLLNEKWDLVVAFPPCTHLAVSGAAWFAKKRADGRQAAGIDFFMRFTELTCPYAIENPVGIMSTLWRRPDQIIQPWQFGEDASKKTCLWLKGLPLLVPTKIITKRLYANQTPSGQNKLGPSAYRSALRSRTYLGVAKAIAEQWSTYL